MTDWFSPNGTGNSSNAADKIDNTSHPGGGKSNYDLETASDQGSGSRSQTPDSAAGSAAAGATPLSGRRERRKKFDVKSLFNMKSATPQTPSNRSGHYTNLIPFAFRKRKIIDIPRGQIHDPSSRRILFSFISSFLATPYWYRTFYLLFEQIRRTWRSLNMPRMLLLELLR